MSRTEQRDANWSSSYRDLNDANVLRTPGDSEFLNAPLTGAEFSTDSTRCQRLLQTFRKSM
jgi:hypothetical protein